MASSVTFSSPFPLRITQFDPVDIENTLAMLTAFQKHRSLYFVGLPFAKLVELCGTLPDGYADDEDVRTLLGAVAFVLKNGGEVWSWDSCSPMKLSDFTDDEELLARYSEEPEGDDPSSDDSAE